MLGGEEPVGLEYKVHRGPKWDKFKHTCKQMKKAVGD